MQTSSVDQNKIIEATNSVRDYLVKTYPNLIRVSLSEIELKTLDRHIGAFLDINPILIDNISKTTLVRKIRERIVGFGVLEDIVKEKEKDVYEIHIKGTEPILAKKFKTGKHIYKDKHFETDEEVYQMALKLLAGDIINGQLSWANPEVESYIGEWRISATMKGYSQVNTITLRRQVVDMTPQKLIELNTANEEMIQKLYAFQQAGLRTIIGGLPDCGKTGTEIAIAHMLDRKRIVFTVEDTKELYIEKFLPYTTAYVVSSKDTELMNRKITASLAVKNVLNQGVETLIIGQLRKNIAYACLEALHSGLHTIMSMHFVRPEDMFNKFDNILQYEIHKPGGYKKEIAEGLDIMLFQERMSDNSVKMNMYEVCDEGSLNRLYYYDCYENANGTVRGEFKKDKDITPTLKAFMNRKGINI